MGFMDEKLWAILEEKAREEDCPLPADQKIANGYITAIHGICQFGVDRAKTIINSFPMYTLHDERHIVNVMRLMLQLLGEEAGRLSRDEAAMLVMAACCHDIGMSCSEEDKQELLSDDRLIKYLKKNPGEYVKAYSGGGEQPSMTIEMTQNYLRSIHHERIEDWKQTAIWHESAFAWMKKDLNWTIANLSWRKRVTRICQ